MAAEPRVSFRLTLRGGKRGTRGSADRYYRDA